MFLAAGAGGICAGSYGSCSVWRGVLIGPLAWFGGGGRESPGRRGTFLCFAKEKYPKERRPHCLRPLRFAPGQPAVLGFGGVSLNSRRCASLRHTRALIRQTLRSSAHPEGQGGTEHPHGPLLRSAPCCGRKRRALRKRGRAKQWPEWMLAVWMFGCPPPAGCACGGAVAGWHARRSARASCSDSPWLSERSCTAAQ